jgi:hypothetical protein
MESLRIKTPEELDLETELKRVQGEIVSAKQDLTKAIEELAEIEGKKKSSFGKKVALGTAIATTLGADAYVAKDYYSSRGEKHHTPPEQKRVVNRPTTNEVFVSGVTNMSEAAGLTTNAPKIEPISEPPVSPKISVPSIETNAPTSTTNTEPKITISDTNTIQINTELSNKLDKAQAEAMTFSNKLAQAEATTATFSNNLAKIEAEAKKVAEIKRQLEEKLKIATTHTPNETFRERKDRIETLLRNREQAKREGRNSAWIKENYPLTGEDANWWNSH